MTTELQEQTGKFNFKRTDYGIKSGIKKAEVMTKLKGIQSNSAKGCIIATQYSAHPLLQSYRFTSRLNYHPLWQRMQSCAVGAGIVYSTQLTMLKAPFPGRDLDSHLILQGSLCAQASASQRMTSGSAGCNKHKFLYFTKGQKPIRNDPFRDTTRFFGPI